MIRGLAIVGAVMIWGAVAQAEIFVLGQGTASCGQFIATIGNRPPGMMRSRRAPDGDLLVSENAVYLAWLLGFVSGVNATAEEQQQIRQVDPAGLDLWMRNWCNKHPTQPVGEAVQLFLNEMRTNAAGGQR